MVKIFNTFHKGGHHDILHPPGLHILAASHLLIGLVIILICKCVYLKIFGSATMSRFAEQTKDRNIIILLWADLRIVQAMRDMVWVLFFDEINRWQISLTQPHQQQNNRSIIWRSLKKCDYPYHQRHSMTLILLDWQHNFFNDHNGKFNFSNFFGRADIRFHFHCKQQKLLWHKFTFWGLTIHNFFCFCGGGSYLWSTGTNSN